MKLSKEARKLSKQLFRESFTGGALDATKVGAVTDTVIRAKPRQYIGVLKEFARLIRLETARRHAIIESASELEAAEKTATTSFTILLRASCRSRTEEMARPMAWSVVSSRTRAARLGASRPTCATR